MIRALPKYLHEAGMSASLSFGFGHDEVPSATLSELD
jgi:hypothetical protein